MKLILSEHLKEGFLQTSNCKNPKYYFSKHLFLFQVNSAGLVIFNTPGASAVFLSLGCRTCFSSM